MLAASAAGAEEHAAGCDGSGGSTKDKDDRFVPLHSKIAARLPGRRKSDPVFQASSERTLLMRLKEL